MPLYRFQHLFRTRIVLFVHIPKTGGSSVERMMREAGGVEAMMGRMEPFGCAPRHFHAEILSSWLRPEFCDGSFTLCRNPYDRLFSEYKMRTMQRKELSFEDWLDEAMAGFAANPYYRDNHLRPQHEFLLPETVVYRMEAGVRSAVVDVCRRMKVGKPRRERHERRRRQAPASIAEATRQRILDFYGKDFKVLGYDPSDYQRSFAIRP